MPNDVVAVTSSHLARRNGDTLADRAYQDIRADIISGRLAPNQRLRLEELRERFTMGFSPIREALMQLNTERLVVQEKMKGFRVAPVSLDHLYDLTRVRKEIEPLAIKWAIENGDAEWEANVIGAFHRLSKQSKRSGKQNGIDGNWRAEHRRYHLSLIAACQSSQLLTICDSLFDQSERYVALSIRYLDEPRDDQGEHQALMEAVIGRKRKAAAELCAQHIQRTTEKVVASSDLLSEAGGAKGD